MTPRVFLGKHLRSLKSSMRRVVAISVDFVNKCLSVVILQTSFSLFQFLNKGGKKSFDWVIGVEDIASTLYGLDRSIENKFSICLFPNHLYNYQFDLMVRGKFPVRLHRLLVGAYLFGKFAAKSKGFVYNGSGGYLAINDEREYEFKFLAKHSRKIVVFFCGSEIRSPKKLADLCIQNGKDHLAQYQVWQSPWMNSENWEDKLKRRCTVTERYADQIYSMNADQASYFTGPTKPYPTLIRDDVFQFNTSKFESCGTVRILHAPSNPFIKGTQVVRAAIKELKSLGYKFDYKELIGVSNEVVIRELRKSHIVLNEFYAFVPGVFGVEALANCCVVLQSADGHVENDLPLDANKAWIVTEAHEIRRNLQRVLDNPDAMKSIAEFGYGWALENCSISRMGKKLNQDLAYVLNNKS
jgi:hypothetical protein